MRERFNDLANQASEGYNVARDNAYSTARQYPGTLAAIVVGIGVTAFLIWAARRAGGWQNLQSTATDYMRDGYARAREGSPVCTRRGQMDRFAFQIKYSGARTKRH